MSVPNPATTDWVPLGGSTVDLRYLGAWAAGSYVDGDVVMGSDNIAYLCVRPTTNAPVSWSGISGPVGPPGPQGPQGPAGIQGPAGAGIPTVQNGKWLNGSGGAAVWASIGQTDLPANIGAGCIDLPSLDCNAVTVTGWYWANNTCVNIPTVQFNGYLFTYVAAWNNGYRRQIAYPYPTLASYERNCSAGAWSAWVQTQWHPTGWVNAATPLLNGWTNYGAPYPPARVQQLASGLVVMSGLLTGLSNTSSTAFTLPAPPAGIGAQFIPNTYRHMGGWATDALASVRIDTGGNVMLSAPSGLGSLAYLTLDNVEYWPY